MRTLLIWVKHITSHNKALPLRAAVAFHDEKSKKKVMKNSRGHIDLLTEPAGRVDSKKTARLVSSSTSAMPNVICNCL